MSSPRMAAANTTPARATSIDDNTRLNRYGPPVAVTTVDKETAPWPSLDKGFSSMLSPRLAAAHTTPARAPSTDDTMRLNSYGHRPITVSTTEKEAVPWPSLEKLWDFVLKDQKDRQESYRELQAQLRQQQDALNSISLRGEKSIDDVVNAELSNMREECSALARKLDTSIDSVRAEFSSTREECNELARKVIVSVENHDMHFNRVDDLSQDVLNLSANIQRHDTSLEELRELVTCKADQESNSVREVREDLHSLKERTTDAIAEVQKFMRDLRAHADDNHAIEHASDETDIESNVVDPVDQGSPPEKVSAECNVVDPVDQAGKVEKESARELSVSEKHAELITGTEGNAGAEVAEPAPPNEAEDQESCEEELREVLIKLIEERLQDCQTEGAAQVSKLERRITEEWTGLRGWVDAAVVAVVNRISSLECTLQTEMADRLSNSQEVAAGAATTGEHLKRMQGEIDKILFDMKVISVSNTFKRSMSKSAQTPPFDDASVSKPGATDKSKPGVTEVDNNTGNSSANVQEKENTRTPPNVEAGQRTSSIPNGATSLPLGSLQQRMQSPQLLNPDSTPTATPGTLSPRFFSRSVSSQPGPPASNLVTGQSLSAPISMAQSQMAQSQGDPLMRSTPRVNLPFMASAPMTNGSHSSATSPLRGGFVYQATSPFVRR